MSPVELILTQVCSAAVLGVMLLLCLRSRDPGPAAGSGPHTYRVHPGWFVFCGVGGLFLVGIFAFASSVTIPENKPSAAMASVLSALFFVFAAWVFRGTSVTLDESTLTAHTRFGRRTVEVKTIESIKIVGLVVEVRFRPDSTTNVRPKPLTFLAGLRGLGGLLANVRMRAGLSPEG